MTQQEAAQFWPLIKKWAEGGELQMLNCDHKWTTFSGYTFDCPLNQYRIKPGSKLRPWRIEEVPVGALIRRINVIDHDVQMILASINNKIHTAVYHGDFPMTTQTVSECWEHSLNNGKTWHPCGVVEETKE